MLDNEVIKRKCAQLRRKVVIDTKWPPCNDEQLDAAEAEVGIKFPPDYRLFLKNINGAIIYGIEHVNVLYCDSGRDDEDDTLIGGFYGVGDKDEVYDVRLEQRAYFFDQWIGAPWLNIGESASHQICLNVDTGAVAAHRIVTEPPGGDEYPPEYDARAEMVPLASSFTEFFNKLRAKSFW